MKFTKLYEELKFDDIFAKANPEEAKERRAKYQEMKLQEFLEDITSKVRLSDGSWRVHTNLDVHRRGLTSLKGLNVSIVDKSFLCNLNNLTSLEGCPREVGNDFSCIGNRLTSLKGSPEVIPGRFYCASNLLTSLEGGPKIVKCSFWCTGNRLKSLVGGPEEVDGSYRCDENDLTSLEGLPKRIGRDLYLWANLKKFTIEEVKKICQVEGEIVV